MFGASDTIRMHFQQVAHTTTNGLSNTGPLFRPWSVLDLSSSTVDGHFWQHYSTHCVVPGYLKTNDDQHDALATLG
jgi:hypothetical protein